MLPERERESMMNTGSEAVDEVAGSHKERGINQLKNRK